MLCFIVRNMVNNILVIGWGGGWGVMFRKAEERVRVMGVSSLDSNGGGGLKTGVLVCCSRS